ncbi:MAG: hypothetical protein AVDCRST_MAG88-3069, partial [uncultured Thermomicrobiales bacterium]
WSPGSPAVLAVSHRASLPRRPQPWPSPPPRSRKGMACGHSSKIRT